MKKILFIAATLTPVLISAPALAGSTDMMNMNGVSMPAGQMSQNTTQQTQTTSVTIQNFAFMPSSIMVSQGATVTWTNHDNTAHTVTGNTSGGPSSGPIQPGQTYSFTFSTAGTFPYHCSIHPQMTGSVTVMAGATQSAPPTQSSQPSGSQSTTNSYGNTSSTSPSGSSTTNMAPSTSEYSKSKDVTTQLPSTGPAEIAVPFIAAALLGTGSYYLYYLLKKRFA